MAARLMQISRAGEEQAILNADLRRYRRRLSSAASRAVSGLEVEGNRRMESRDAVSIISPTIGRTIAVCQTKTAYADEKSCEGGVSVATTSGPTTITGACESPSKIARRRGPKSATAAIAICPALPGMGRMRGVGVFSHDAVAEVRGPNAEVASLETKNVATPTPNLVAGVALSDLATACPSQDLDFRQPKNFHYGRGLAMVVVAAPDAESRI